MCISKIFVYFVQKYIKFIFIHILTCTLKSKLYDINIYIYDIWRLNDDDYVVLCHGHSFRSKPFAFSIAVFISNDSPKGIPYPTLKPYGLDGVIQSDDASFRRALSTSTDVKKAIDCGKSLRPIL